MNFKILKIHHIPPILILKDFIGKSQRILWNFLWLFLMKILHFWHNYGSSPSKVWGGRIYGGGWRMDGKIFWTLRKVFDLLWCRLRRKNKKSSTKNKKFSSTKSWNFLLQKNLKLSSTENLKLSSTENHQNLQLFHGLIYGRICALLQNRGRSIESKCRAIRSCFQFVCGTLRFF